MDNNPIWFNDVLGDKVKYGYKNSDRKTRKRIKAQIKWARKNDSGFNADFKAKKKDKDNTFRYIDEVIGATGRNGQTVSASNPIGVSPFFDEAMGENVVQWDRSLVTLPSGFDFYANTSRKRNFQSWGIEKNKEYGQELENASEIQQVANWMVAHPERKLNIVSFFNDKVFYFDSQGGGRVNSKFYDNASKNEMIARVRAVDVMKAIKRVSGSGLSKKRFKLKSKTIDGRNKVMFRDGGGYSF